MPRGERLDEPGAWCLVFNRGLARRTLFEAGNDGRAFLALLARCVRNRRFEVHAYCLMATHFHLLLRSVDGNLSDSMQWVQNQYVRWFNRARRRDGPLMRGRFGSRRADSLTYRRHLVTYIDFNPVEAGLVPAPALYRHGSAWHYARASGPPWLTRDWVESELSIPLGAGETRAQRYARRFGTPLPEPLARWIEERSLANPSPSDPLDDLVGAAPPIVRDWMRRKAELGDGGREVGLHLCTPEAIELELELFRLRGRDREIERKKGEIPASTVLRTGLLSDLSARTLAQVAHGGPLSPSVIWHHERLHRELLQTDNRNVSAAAELAAAALRSCHRIAAPPPSDFQS